MLRTSSTLYGKVKAKFFLSTLWSHAEEEEVYLHLLLTLVPDGG